ncbi:MAG: bifunctional response regulator/alkaline phosphatase family protein [Fibrobacter sp.]|nr:bifunctional response regulator/alkaline phosphatase family protein [Fibrobacter sp.]
MSGGRKKVLWVDDEIEFLRSHIMFLETRGYSVIPVFSGDDAIQMLQENPKEFDIVLLDEQMPGKDGLTTLEEIRDFLPDLPIVMVTKSEEEQVMEDALGKKINGYLTKPVNPSQILLVCKNLLDSKRIMSSQISQKFVRSYTDLRKTLSGKLSLQDWVKMYESVVRWDLELENVENEGLRQTLAGLKSECNTAFSNFIMDHYGEWIRGIGPLPTMAPGIIDKYLVPLLNDNKKVAFVVLSGMRLDQYYDIEQSLKKFYDVRRGYFFSIVPSATPFSRNALLAGAFPAEIAQRCPDLWKDGNEDSSVANRMESQLMSQKLATKGIDCPVDEPWFTKIKTTTDVKELLDKVEQCRKSKIMTFVIDFFDLLMKNRTSSSMLQEITNDESGFRSLTQSWFQRSSLLNLLKELAELDYTVVLTSDHGSTSCSRGTELYGVSDWVKNHRYKFGKEISCDERTVLYLGEPTHFGLPKFGDDVACIIAKENYYFIHHEKFENYHRQYKNSFQQGGISMEEIIMPVGIFSPLQHGGGM